MFYAGIMQNIAILYVCMLLDITIALLMLYDYAEYSNTLCLSIMLDITIALLMFYAGIMQNISILYASIMQDITIALRMLYVCIMQNIAILYV